MRFLKNETDYLTNEEMKGVKWTKYKIIVQH